MCDGCGGPGDGLLHRCSRCWSAFYCGEECQKAHWRAHKAVCRSLPKAPQRCSACHTEHASLQKCGGCRQAAYCNRDCQVAHWRLHKAECGKPA